MIDFRYHLVSIIAVFLALAVGLLVGSTALSGKLEETLRLAQVRVTHANTDLTKANRALLDELNADQAFAQAGESRLLRGLLTGQKAVLIVAPGASGAAVSGITASLRTAGASVTGQLQLTNQFLDPSDLTDDSLTQLVQRLAPEAGVTLPTQPVSSAVADQQEAALVLAASVLTTNGIGLPASTSRAILNEFAQAGFVNSTTVPGPAELAVLVTPSGPPPGSGSSSQVLAAVAHELKAASNGTVMAGDTSSIGTGSAIDVEDGVGDVSTVDYADTSIGQIVVVQALVLAMDGKAPQQYGIASGVAPSPAPTPSASPSQSPSVPTRGRR